MNNDIIRLEYAALCFCVKVNHKAIEQTKELFAKWDLKMGDYRAWFVHNKVFELTMIAFI